MGKTLRDSLFVMQIVLHLKISLKMWLSLFVPIMFKQTNIGEKHGLKMNFKL